jgi:hypothetical protein
MSLPLTQTSVPRIPSYLVSRKLHAVLNPLASYPWLISSARLVTSERRDRGKPRFSYFCFSSYQLAPKEIYLYRSIVLAEAEGDIPLVRTFLTRGAKTESHYLFQELPNLKRDESEEDLNFLLVWCQSWSRASQGLLYCRERQASVGATSPNKSNCNWHSGFCAALLAQANSGRRRNSGHSIVVAIPGPQSLEGASRVAKVGIDCALKY